MPIRKLTEGLSNAEFAVHAMLHMEFILYWMHQCCPNPLDRSSSTPRYMEILQISKAAWTELFDIDHIRVNQKSLIPFKRIRFGIRWHIDLKALTFVATNMATLFHRNEDTHEKRNFLITTNSISTQLILIIIIFLTIIIITITSKHILLIWIHISECVFICTGFSFLNHLRFCHSSCPSFVMMLIWNVIAVGIFSYSLFQCFWMW